VHAQLGIGLLVGAGVVWSLHMLGDLRRRLKG
jgi:hypothetical protein